MCKDTLSHKGDRFRHLSMLGLFLVMTSVLTGCWCPDAYHIGPQVTTKGPYATFSACETARTGPAPCKMAKPAACDNHCKTGLGCLGTLKNETSYAGTACYPKESGGYHYDCVEEADCDCI